MDSVAWIVALGVCSGGGLWIEDVSGRGHVATTDRLGVVRAGRVESIHGSPARLHSGQRHAMAPSVGDALCVEVLDP